MNDSGMRKRQIAIFGLLFLFVVGVPATFYLSQRQQDTRSKASASTTLYLVPSTSSSSPLQKNVGDTVSFDVMINPGNNLPSLVKLQLTYDATKLQPSSPAFVVNTTAFPTTLEGPVVTSGSIILSMSIGSDTTKAVQAITKVGTVTFTTVAATSGSPSVISIGNKSQVLSVASSDQANENVLSTTTPAYLAIEAAAVSPTVTSIPPTGTPTPIPTATLTPTPQPTNTPTPLLSATPTIISSTSPTEILTPTSIPTATPTFPPSATTLALTVFMHGIGNSGDNANPTASGLSNKNPLHPARDVTVTVFDAANQLVKTVTGTITYDQDQGDFVGTVDLGNTLASDSYTVKIQSPSHLRRLVPGIQNLVAQQANNMPEVTLIAGDINGDNFMNILDYNLLVGCYSDLQPAVSCTAANKILSDLNDDGAVNQIDYNLFLREITVQNGN